MAMKNLQLFPANTIFADVWRFFSLLPFSSKIFLQTWVLNIYRYVYIYPSFVHPWPRLFSDASCNAFVCLMLFWAFLACLDLRLPILFAENAIYMRTLRYIYIFCFVKNTGIHTCRSRSRRTSVYTCIDIYIHTYIHTYTSIQTNPHR